jgi:hypothetical protein
MHYSMAMSEAQDTHESKVEGSEDKRRRNGSGREHVLLQATALLVMGSHVRGHETKFRAWRTNRGVRIAFKGGKKNKKERSNAACRCAHRHLCRGKGHSNTVMCSAWFPRSLK